jgi:hypothetical protein
VGHVAHTEDDKCIQNFGRKRLKGRDHLEDLDADGSLLEWILEKYRGKDCSGPEYRTMAIPWEDDNKRLGFMTHGKFLD